MRATGSRSWRVSRGTSAGASPHRRRRSARERGVAFNQCPADVNSRIRTHRLWRNDPAAARRWSPCAALWAKFPPVPPTGRGSSCRAAMAATRRHRSDAERRTSRVWLPRRRDGGRRGRSVGSAATRLCATSSRFGRRCIKGRQRRLTFFDQGSGRPRRERPTTRGLVPPARRSSDPEREGALGLVAPGERAG